MVSCQLELGQEPWSWVRSRGAPLALYPGFPVSDTINFRISLDLGAVFPSTSRETVTTNLSNSNKVVF